MTNNNIFLCNKCSVSTVIGGGVKALGASPLKKPPLIANISQSLLQSVDDTFGFHEQITMQLHRLYITSITDLVYFVHIFSIPLPGILNEYFWVLSVMVVHVFS